MSSKHATSHSSPLLRAAVFLVLAALAAGCSSAAEPGQDAATVPPITPTSITPSATADPGPLPVTQAVTSPPATLTPGPDDWQSAPVLPDVSQTMHEVYEHGQLLGNDPHAFSKIGDSETFTSWFLAPFDRHPPTYDLGPYSELQAVIDVFQGSFARQSLAARQGFNAASVFAPLWADPTQCEPGETPLACEFRLHRPSFVFILLGTNDYLHLDGFEGQMRKIIEFSLGEGVVPIIGLKADNLEGDHSINRTLYHLAVEYQLPLWNFWRAVQGLPSNGLDEDHAHLTFGANEFGNPDAMRRAWPVRNLTALQSLDRVWRAVSAP
jgi:hypothetical protein